MEEEPKSKFTIFLSRLIIGTLFFIICAGLLVQCTQKAGKVADVVFDHPED
jgi:hypothetical protein